jgi:uncharacterized membrane protein (UPF0127 family)
MPSNQTRRQLLDRIKISNFPGSIIDVFKAADQGIDLISQHEQQQHQEQQQQNMQVANTPEEQAIGLREEHAKGNTGASMAFPNVQPGQSFNTVGMKAPIDIQKIDDQGHLVESYKNVPPGIQDLPTGPYEGTIIESPSGYQTGGFKNYIDKATPFNEIGDTIIYPPGDSQYKYEPYNKEILDIRPKLQRMGIYNVENKDLQKRYFWEQEQERLRKIQFQNRPRSAQKGGYVVKPRDGHTYMVDKMAVINDPVRNTQQFSDKPMYEGHNPSTHLMADDDKLTAWPIIFQDKSGNWFEGGRKEAEKRGEVYKFNTREEMIDFARKGNWKNTYKKGGLRKMQNGGSRNWTDNMVDTFNAMKNKEGPFEHLGYLVDPFNTWTSFIPDIGKTSKQQADILKNFNPLETFYRNQLGKVSHSFDVLSIPSALVAESMEGTGSGDQEFNLTHALPAFSGDMTGQSWGNPGEPMKVPSQVAGVGSYTGDWGDFGEAFGYDTFYDPLTYVGGIGALRTFLQKGARSGISGISRGRGLSKIPTGPSSNINFANNVVHSSVKQANKTFNKLQEFKNNPLGRELTESQNLLLNNKERVLSSIQKNISKDFKDGYITLYRYGPTKYGLDDMENWYSSNPLGPRFYQKERLSGDVHTIKVPVKDLNKYYANLQSDEVLTTFQEFNIPKGLLEDAKTIPYSEYLDNLIGKSDDLFKQKGGFRNKIY